MSRKYLSYDSSGLNLNSSADVLIDNITAGGSQGLAGEVLQKSNPGNALVWGVSPMSVVGRVIENYYVRGTDLNQIAATPIPMNVVSTIDSMSGDVTVAGANNFLVNTNGRYKISVNLATDQSGSDIQVYIMINASPVVYGLVGSTETSTNMSTIRNLVNTDTISVESIRQSGTAMKLIYDPVGADNSSNIIIERIA